jgi:hypothetical protein
VFWLVQYILAVILFFFSFDMAVWSSTTAPNFWLNVVADVVLLNSILWLARLQSNLPDALS